MANHDTNVVAFQTAQAKQRDGARRGDNRLVGECKSIFSGKLGELLQGFFARVDDELFKLSDKAENSTVQTVYFDAMRYMRRERDTIERQYLETFLSRYDEFWQNKPVAVAVFTAKPVTTELDEDNFALVEDETLEEDLAVNTMVEKATTLLHPELFGLGRRFGAMLNRDEIPSDQNPIGPSAVSRAFSDILRPRAIELRVKLVIYKLFDQAVVSQLGPVYHDINSYLIGEGVLPHIPRARRPPGDVPADAAATAKRIAETLEEAESGDSTAYLEAFQAMQSLLDGWRNQLGLPSVAPGNVGAMTLNATEVLSALSLLQNPAQLANFNDAIVSGEGLKLHVTRQIGQLPIGEDGRGLGRLEEDIIDMVAMIFDFILEDRNLPDAIKALIARLQIPVVKVAILDKAFFAKKSHPARVLLNSLAQAGIGLDIADSSSDNPTFKKIEEVVSRILKDFEQDVALFSDLLAEFTDFMERESQRSRVVEERTRQTTQSKEQVRLAKKQVAHEIARMLTGRHVPEPVQSFLFNAWKDVMVLACLRREKSPEDWSQSVDVAERLIRTVLVPRDPEGRQELAQAIPVVLMRIKQGLEAISYEPAQVSQWMRDIQAVHVTILRAAATGIAPPPQPVQKVVIRDPELAEEIRQIRANLPDIEDITWKDVGVAPPDAPPDDNVIDEFSTKANKLSIGDWVEFQPDGQAPWRAKLSWRSEVSSLFVFVNRKGVKIAEMTASQLAAQLRSGTASLIEGSNTPLMDRALSALMQSLKNPIRKSDPSA